MNKKLHVGNLATAAEENQLQALFSAAGRRVISVKILTDPKTKRSRGYAFVEMGSEADAESAMDDLHGKALMGRTMTVTEARESPNSTHSDDDPEDARIRAIRRAGRGEF